jgi:hypothetical protein
MVFRVVEYGGFQSGRPMASGVASLTGLIQAQSAAPGVTTSTFQLSGGTRFILVDTDVGAIFSAGSSVASTVTNPVTSSMAQHIAANIAPVGFYVAPSMKLFMLST